jgi:Calcineurin-like phosphoesterase
MARTTKTRKGKTPAGSEVIENTGTTALAKPVFAQPQPTPDPTRFVVNHPSDSPVYKQIDELNREHKIAPLPFPAPRGLPEPTLTLAAVLATDAHALQEKLKTSGQIVFHATGDTGSTRGPETQNLVADKMVDDFTDDDKDRPMFFFHLGDVIYSFGEAEYYYDQFYEPYRNYAAPIIALAGNHDGMVAPNTNASTLAAFLENFCASEFEVTSEAGGLARSAQIQPERLLYLGGAAVCPHPGALQQYARRPRSHLGCDHRQLAAHLSGDGAETSDV